MTVKVRPRTADHVKAMSSPFAIGEPVKLVDAEKHGVVVAHDVVPGLVRVHLLEGGPGLLDVDVPAERLQRPDLSS